MNQKKRNMLINIIITASLSFLLILIGLNVVAGAAISVQNVLYLVGFSVFLGMISTLLYLLNLKYACYIFNAGIAVGIFEMYRALFKDLDGWGDLVAFASLFVWILIGLASGLTVQASKFFYDKFLNKKSNRPEDRPPIYNGLLLCFLLSG